jgi:glycerol-3-phosphate O-acyltransferase/dihydroxyacetone phosphate acyltransferase
MLYSSLKFILRIALRVFFRKIYLRNRELIPEKGPLIICANHPATFLDPLVIGSLFKPEVFFLAKGEAFRSHFAQWMLPRLNMIPVYRQQDDPSQMHKNKDTFRRCFEHLERGGVILIFPEGVSLTERKLRKIKSGTARIALGAESRNAFGLGLKVLNIGLNYTNPHKFNQDLYINVEKPILVKEYATQYTRNEQEASAALTEAIRKSLEHLIIEVEDQQTDDLVSKIELIYKQRLAKDIKLNPAEASDDFRLTKSIVETVSYFKKADPRRVEFMRVRIGTYLDNLSRARISDQQLNPEGRKESMLYNNLATLFFITVGFPFYLFGLLNNILPFEIPTYISKRYAPSTDFVGAIALVTGTFFFLIFYTMQIMLFKHYEGSYYHTLLYAISLPVSGLFAYLYWYIAKDLHSRWLLMSLFFRKKALISGFIRERMEIIESFDRAKEDYILRAKVVTRDA